jgi:hypothetical protein
MKTKIIQNAKTIILALILTLCVGYVSASSWTGPTAAAPLGNTDTPINAGNAPQIKKGNLDIVGLTTSGAAATYGLVVDGVINSTTGGVKFPDGTVQTTAAAGESQLATSVFVKSTVSSTNTAISSNCTVGFSSGSTINGYLCTNTAVVAIPTGKSYACFLTRTVFEDSYLSNNSTLGTKGTLIEPQCLVSGNQLQAVFVTSASNIDPYDVVACSMNCIVF